MLVPAYDLGQGLYGTGQARQFLHFPIRVLHLHCLFDQVLVRRWFLLSQLYLAGLSLMQGQPQLFFRLYLRLK